MALLLISPFAQGLDGRTRLSMLVYSKHTSRMQEKDNLSPFSDEETEVQRSKLLSVVSKQFGDF